MEASERRYGTGMRILVYVLSLLIPLVGIIIFVVFYGRDVEARTVGRNALIAAIIGLVLGCIGCSVGGIGGGLLGVLSGSS